MHFSHAGEDTGNNDRNARPPRSLIDLYDLWRLNVERGDAFASWIESAMRNPDFCAWRKSKEGMGVPRYHRWRGSRKHRSAQQRIRWRLAVPGDLLHIWDRDLLEWSRFHPRCCLLPDVSDCRITDAMPVSHSWSSL